MLLLAHVDEYSFENADFIMKTQLCSKLAFFNSKQLVQNIWEWLITEK